MMWFLQMAQLSTTISANHNNKHQSINQSNLNLTKNENIEAHIQSDSTKEDCSWLPQAQRATALHFLTSNLLAFLLDEEAATELEDSPAGIMFTSESREAISIDWSLRKRKP